MAAPPYLLPLPGYETGYQVAAPFPTYPYPLPSPPTYVAPSPKGTLAMTLVKVAVGGVAGGVIYYVAAKVLQSQNINVGCPAGQVGLPFICAPSSSPPPSTCGACSSSCPNGTCPSGQNCVNGTCQTQSVPQIPGSLVGSSNVPVNAQVCQPVTASATSGCGVAVCGSPITCTPVSTMIVTLLDNSPQQLPIANAIILVANANPNIIQTDAQSYKTDSNGRISVTLIGVNPPTFACSWSVTIPAAITFAVQTLLPSAGGPSLVVNTPMQVSYKTNEGFLGTCGGCSTCSG